MPCEATAPKLGDQVVAPKTLGDRLSKGMIVVVLAGKFAKLLKLLKASAVVAKFAKLGITFATMAISTVAYAFTFGGWWFALGLIGMIFIHEMGHVAAMRREGMETRAPVFIPLLGAVIFAPKMEGRAQEARIGYAGPLVGTLGVLAVFLLALATSGGLRTGLLIASYLGAIINLFNLIVPVRPLDGGRVTQIIGDWFKYLGLVILLAIILLTQARGLLLILIFILLDFKWPVRLRASTAVLSTSVLFTMVVFHLGKPQPAVLDLLDLFAASIITAVFVREAIGGEEQLSETRHAGERASWPVRLKWLGLYFGLIFVLIGLMAMHAAVLPPEVSGR